MGELNNCARRPVVGLKHAWIQAETFLQIRENRAYRKLKSKWRLCFVNWRQLLGVPSDHDGATICQPRKRKRGSRNIKLGCLIKNYQIK
jgi:hypothetical protein